MDYYYIFEDYDNDCELVAVCAEDIQDAFNILEDNGFETRLMNLVEEFPADMYGDDIIDSYGLDVY